MHKERTCLKITFMISRALKLDLRHLKGVICIREKGGKITLLSCCHYYLCKENYRSGINP